MESNGHICRNGGIGRRPGLKIPWDFISYRFDPGFRHQYIAEWSSLVARRAHNPEVMRFKSLLRNHRLVERRVFFFCLRQKWCGGGIWASRASLFDLGFASLQLSRPDLCLLGVALRKINEANCRDPFRLYGGGILPARSNQVMLCANKSIIVKRKSERQITRSKFAQSGNRT